jgi:peptide/nickel transport system permease protein
MTAATAGARAAFARSFASDHARLGRFVAGRLILSLLTLWLLSMIVFAGGQLLPGDVGRAILGPLADPRAVAVLNHQLGVDRPLVAQYVDWVTRLLHGDMGNSYAFRSAVAPFVGAALANSLKLGALAFVIVVPLGIAGGVWAALHAGRWLDRLISVAGLAATVVPEFVSSIVLILIFGIWLQWLPIEATAPPGASVALQLQHLILPALPLVLVFFGYIARMARAGTVEALDADYTRTAVLKGLPRGVVIRRHVLRNALVPTITVATTQLGYMIGGLVVVETLFHYQGIGLLIYTAAQGKDFPMLEAGVLAIGVVYTLANLGADLLVILLNPRLRSRVAE